MALIITIPGGAVQLSGNRVQAEVTTDVVQGSLYRLLLKTSSLDNSFPEGIDAIEPDSDKKAIFDLRNRVSMPVDYDFSWPLLGDVFIKRAQLAKKVAIDIGESFIPATPTKQINWAGLNGAAVQVLILKGAISKHEQAKYNESGKTFYQEYIEAGRFLTNLPTNQRVAPGQPLKLWFITKETAQQNLTLKVNYTYLDGTTGSIGLNGTIDPDAMYEICVDTGSIGLNASLVDFYTVSLQKDGIDVSEIRRYTIDHTWYENNTFVFYANRVAGIDSVWFPGAIKESFPTESQTSERNTQTTDTQKKGSIEVDYKTGYRKWDINSGYRTIAEQIALRELLNSCNVWFIDGNDVIPAILEDGDNPLYNTIEDLQGIELSFREAH
jgi:hypothetical protein